MGCPARFPVTLRRRRAHQRRSGFVAEKAVGIFGIGSRANHSARSMRLRQHGDVDPVRRMFNEPVSRFALDNFVIKSACIPS